MKTKPGRPFVPANLKRNKMTGVRIQQYRLDWLRKQKQSSGKIIEELLDTIMPEKEVTEDGMG